MAEHPLLVETRETEIVEETADTGAPEATQEVEEQSDPDIPAQWAGKSQADLIRILQEKESFIGQQSSEVGTYKSLVNDLMEIKTAKDRALAEETEPPVAITTDDLLEGNPTEAIARVVRQELERSLAPVRADIDESKLNAEQQRFVADFPNFAATVADEEFIAWKNRNPRRQAKVKAAADGDIFAARELLEDWSDLQTYLQPVQEESPEPDPAPQAKQRAPTGVAGARRVATESGGSTEVAKGKRIYTQSEIVDLIMNDSAKYNSPHFQKELSLAAREGRIVQ